MWPVRLSSELELQEEGKGRGRLGKKLKELRHHTKLGLVLCVCKGNVVISRRAPAGIGIMIPAFAPFNK